MKSLFKNQDRHPQWQGTPAADWRDWRWQMRHSLKTLEQFSRLYNMSDEETLGFSVHEQFQVRTTPYYASLVNVADPEDPIRKIFMPHAAELVSAYQEMEDPLAEEINAKTPRLIHRYADRVLFLVTDVCGVYCRFCTRKHFTGSNEAMVSGKDYETSLEYIRQHPGIREVLLSGGDPLTVSNTQLEKVLKDLRDIEHVEIIRIGSRMPVVNPMRLTPELGRILRKYAPVFLMSHFSHPRELTTDAVQGLAHLIDCGIPVFNQMVLLNGVNNHPALIQALSRRLLYARVKPYYMFQCDPSKGTDHLRTSVDHSLEIQRELWGHLSGLAMPSLALDLPGGGGKVGLVPNFETGSSENRRSFRGFDGVEADYISPPMSLMKVPSDVMVYEKEWFNLKNAKTAFHSSGLPEAAETGASAEAASTL